MFLFKPMICHYRCYKKIIENIAITAHAQNAHIMRNFL